MRCKICGKPLKNKKSLSIGIGPECQKAYTLFLSESIPGFHNESGPILKAMCERTVLLEQTICPECGYKGLEPLSFTKAQCKKCKMIHQL